MAKDAEKLAKIDPKSNHFQVHFVQSTEFDSISSTFGFEHHEGTNYQLELKIIKEILIRQGLLMTLQHMCQYLNERNKETLEQQEGEQLILTLRKLRDCTVNLLEVVQLWRQSSEKYDAAFPQPFFWEGENYVLKMVIDLDFLADTRAIIDALHLPAEKCLSNPLMLPNTLHEGSVSTDPMERAQFDAGGECDGAVFEERLRIRRAEQLLLREVEYYAKEPSPSARMSPMADGDTFVPSIPSEYLGLGRPPTRGGDSRRSSHRSNRKSLVSSPALIGESSPEHEIDDEVRGNITYSDVDRLCKLLMPSPALQTAASIIIILLSERYKVDDVIRLFISLTILQNPTDLSWTVFLNLCRDSDISWDLNSLDISTIHEVCDI